MKSFLPISVGVVKHSIHPNGTASDSDEEHFSDVPGSDDEDVQNEVPTQTNGNDSSDHVKTTAVWDHRNLQKTNKRSSIVVGYDNAVRDPRFARALGQPCWQLLLLANHVHPTVAYFANSLIKGGVFRYTGDPFEDLSVAHFMERFVYKKPKPIPTKTGRLKRY